MNTFSFTDEELECIRVCVSNSPIPYDITLKEIPKKGTIITYHQSFEKGVIEELAKFCTDIATDLRALNERIVDLKDPFVDGGYYHPDFEGSFSITIPGDRLLKSMKLGVKSSQNQYMTINQNQSYAQPDSMIQVGNLSRMTLKKSQRGKLRYKGSERSSIQAVFYLFDNVKLLKKFDNIKKKI